MEVLHPEGSECNEHFIFLEIKLFLPASGVLQDIRYDFLGLEGMYVS